MAGGIGRIVDSVNSAAAGKQMISGKQMLIGGLGVLALLAAMYVYVYATDKSNKFFGALAGIGFLALAMVIIAKMFPFTTGP